MVTPLKKIIYILRANLAILLSTWSLIYNEELKNRKDKLKK